MPQKGWVALTIAPGKRTMGTFVDWHRDLIVDLEALLLAGATALVPLTEDEEMRRLGIPDLVDRAQQKSLDVLRFPFHDGGVPKSLEATVRRQRMFSMLSMAIL